MILTLVPAFNLLIISVLSTLEVSDTGINVPAPLKLEPGGFVVADDEMVTFSGSINQFPANPSAERADALP